MTFCLGIKLKDGIVGISDTRVTSGRAIIKARKVFIFEKEDSSLFIMTSGLRSIRDKVITYFEEQITNEERHIDRLYKAVNLLGEIVRQVAKEDKASLVECNMQFDIHCLIGGQLENDDEHKLYLLYPQGNWVEISQSTPYQIIGETSYGKPVLDRTLEYDDELKHALKVGILSFDSTRISATDVDFPIDIVIYYRDSYHIIEHRYEKEEFRKISQWWQEKLRKSVNELPSTEIDAIFHKLDPETEDTITNLSH